MELSLNQATTRPYGLAETAAAAERAGIRHLGLWVEPVEQTGLAETRRILSDHGLGVSSVCRVGFVADKDGAELRGALDGVKRGLELSHEVGAPMLTFIAGGLPSGDRDIVRAGQRVRDALETLVPFAEDAGVRLALEPLHPLFVTSRSVVTSIAQALDMIRDLPVTAIGILIDAYATFWDPRFAESAAAAGERIAGYQISDFALPLPEPENMNGRLFPGDGEIDFAPLNGAVRAAGFSGPTEVEIFNDDIWALDLDTIVDRTVRGFAQATRSAEAVTR
ncbi:sugar phosphate isomerase/epimerase family protein [Microbacterium hydrocarbonoxydans]|uniref:sugar phosphate isomerase/epimerase family protein n=1 Tax=Microbacterium hydrocarbonoxydans TaxID=273678 RepID=UPI00203ECE61|nr:sugar phosphate isomerase/epimerase family protein [Microbacterium hydrocarbonoxydans]MCM3780770.1 sugar phosphate isomerase/epimerase [Microbacterium hydrocarbonoxydans]